MKRPFSPPHGFCLTTRNEVLINCDTVFTHLVSTADRDGCAHGEPMLVYRDMWLAAYRRGAPLGSFRGRNRDDVHWAKTEASLARLVERKRIKLQVGPLESCYSGPVLTALILNWGTVRPKRSAIPLKVRVAVYERDGNRCVNCGATERLSLDHVIPWSHGGSDHVGNLQTMCVSCNSSKSNRVDRSRPATKGVAS